MRIEKVCILGGAGFVGRHLATRLAREGLRCRVPSRHPQRHRDLLVLPGLELTTVSDFDTASLQQLFAGCDAVVNLIGILNPRHDGDFRKVHVELVDRIADAGRESGVKRLLHMSALNASASQGSSEYLRSKGEGENQAHTRGHAAMCVTSFRPSVIFGPGDGFFNRFAGLLRSAPGVVPLACSQARFQPVYVGDVADAFARSLQDHRTWERHYELCGPRVYTLRQLVEYTAAVIGRRVRVVELNDALSRLQARAMQYLPGKPFTFDNYLSMQMDSTCHSDGLAQLGIRPHSVEERVPAYLGGGGERSRYGQLRRLS
jgi:uncharacterized protein YbjT (DUF2867 family)